MARYSFGKHVKNFEGDQKVAATKVKTGAIQCVIQSFQRRENAKGTKSVRYKVHVLKALDEANKEAVGSSFTVDYWADFAKEANAARLAFLLLSTGSNETELDGFDPDSDDAMLAVTGVPFAMKLLVSSRKNDQNPNRPWIDVEVEQVKVLTAETRKRYTEAPDWANVVGKREDRVEEPYKAKAKEGTSNNGGSTNDSGGGGGTTTTTDPFTDPDDDSLPF